MAQGRRGRNKKPGPKGERKWDEKFYKMIPDLILEGLTLKKIADIIGVNPKTIHQWKKEKKRLGNAITKARDKVDCAKVEKSQLKRAIGFRYTEVTREYDQHGRLKAEKKTRKYVPGDTKAQQFYLRNRARERWPDIKSTEIGGPDGGAIPVAAGLSEEERAELKALSEKVVAELVKSSAQNS